MSEENKHSHIYWKKIKYEDRIIEYDNHWEMEDGRWINWEYNERFQAQRYLRRHPNSISKRTRNCDDKIEELKYKR